MSDTRAWADDAEPAQSEFKNLVKELPDVLPRVRPTVVGGVEVWVGVLGR